MIFVDILLGLHPLFSFRLLHAACRMPLRVAQSAQLLCIFLLKSRVSADWKAFCNAIFLFLLFSFSFPIFFCCSHCCLLGPFSAWYFHILHACSLLTHWNNLFSQLDRRLYTFYTFYSDRSDELLVRLLFKKKVREKQWNATTITINDLICIICVRFIVVAFKPSVNWSALSNSLCNYWQIIFKLFH